jgi:C1A family cysteine protease
MTAIVPGRFRAGAAPRATRGLVLALALGLAGPLAAAGQTAPPPAGQVQYITRTQFNAMVRAGTLVPLTHRTLAQGQRILREERRRDRDIVEDYLQLHPELTTLKAIVNGGPDVDGDADHDGGQGRSSSADGLPLSFVNVNGQRQTEVLLGRGTTLDMLANSIRQLRLPTAQLQLYTTFYNELPAALCRPSDNNAVGVGGVCAGLPTPASLRGAPLATVRSALGALGKLAIQIVAILPPPAQSGPVACPADIGNNNAPSANITWGDQTITAGCPAPSAAGLYANFNFLNKNLISCIKNQGHRGTCHIFAATSAMEEMVARDTGTYVNLNEQDFQENLKLYWEKNSPDFNHDSGSSWGDLNAAAAHNYQFAYENQWDYNPSYNEPINTYINTCVGYPSSEPGCSETAPQAPEYCVYNLPQLCAVAPTVLPGARSPYRSGNVSNVWNAANPQLTFNLMILGLALNNAVLLGFNVTNNFQGAPGGYVPTVRSDLSTSVGGHEVHVIGYVSNQDLAGVLPQAPPGAGGGYFIIKNSWGACTGDAGYYYMPVYYLLTEANEVDIVSTEFH